jgi:hypothetical protein
MEQKPVDKITTVYILIDHARVLHQKSRELGLCQNFIINSLLRRYVSELKDKVLPRKMVGVKTIKLVKIDGGLVESLKGLNLSALVDTLIELWERGEVQIEVPAPKPPPKVEVPASLTQVVAELKEFLEGSGVIRFNSMLRFLRAYPQWTDDYLAVVISQLYLWGFNICKQFTGGRPVYWIVPPGGQPRGIRLSWDEVERVFRL